MSLLIVSATYEEIAPSIPYLDQHNISYLITGVGMVATTYTLTQYLASNSCKTLINVGIAGSFDKSVVIGDLLQIEKDTFSELGAENNGDFIRIDDLGFGQSTYHSNEPFFTDLDKVSGITVNTIHGSEASIDSIKKIYPGITTESMEGAAVFYVAKQCGVNAIQVRSISNYVEKRDKSTWNIPLAIQNLNIWLVDYLQKFY